MPSNICKNPDLLRFHSPRIKLKKTAFFKGSRGISPLKFPPIPSPGLSPCAVAWKCDSARIPKSCLYYKIFFYEVECTIRLAT